MANKVFINYRRDDDPGFAFGLFLSLKQAGFEVVIDVAPDTIQPGAPFDDALRAKIAASHVMLVLIGRRWVEALTARPDHAEDQVVLEIAEALARGIWVIPVLFGRDVEMPIDVLPHTIRKLGKNQAVRIQPSRMVQEVEYLLADLKIRADHPPPPQPAAPPQPKGQRRQRAGSGAVIAIANHRARTGKTTTAVNLGAALALMGQRVLVIDLAPDGNASAQLGYPRFDVRKGLYDVFTGACSIDAVRLATEIAGLDLLPADRDLIGTEVDLVGAEDPEFRLHSVLGGVTDRYEFVLIDCPASLGLLMVNALVAADSVLVPTDPEYYAMEGMSALLTTIDQVRRSLHPSLRREGFLITMSDIRNNLSKEVEAQVRQLFGDAVFTTVIPRNVRLSVAESWSMPLVQLEPKSVGARSYFALAEELLTRRQIPFKPVGHAV